MELRSLFVVHDLVHRHDHVRKCCHECFRFLGDRRASDRGRPAVNANCSVLGEERRNTLWILGAPRICVAGRELGQLGEIIHALFLQGLSTNTQQPSFYYGRPRIFTDSDLKSGIQETRKIPFLFSWEDGLLASRFISTSARESGAANLWTQDSSSWLTISARAGRAGAHPDRPRDSASESAREE